MSSRQQYAQPIHALAINQVVADLVEEKASISSNATLNTETYVVKLSALHGMCIAMTKNTQVKRVV